jgi:tetratricopeptide (TPR) repeat protein
VDESVERRRPLGLPAWGLALVAAVAVAAWVATGALARRTLVAQLPPLLVDGAPPAARDAIAAADRDARQAPSADAVGALAIAYHASQLPVPAIAAYAVAEALGPGEWRWTYLRALLLEERGDASGAGAAFQQVLARTPGHGPSWFRVGELAFKSGRLDEAHQAYHRARDAAAEPAFTPPGVTARQTQPLAAYARLGLARVAIERGQPDVAERELRAALDGYPAFGPARGLLREVARVRGGAVATERTRAPGSFVPPFDPRLDAVVATSRHPDLLLKHAGLATRAGDTAWREFLALRALDAAPADLNVLMEVSALRQSQGRFEEALEPLRRHEALAPGDHHALVQQGKVLADLGRFADAEAVLRRAAVVRDTTAEFNLGTVLDQQGRWEEARVHYDRALAIDPFNTSAMNNLAAGLDRRNQTAAALVLFERAIAIAPDTGDYYVNYGNALVQASRFDDAVRTLTTAVELSPRSANAHNNLGIALARQGDLAKARDAFARAVDIDPRHESARGNLAQVTGALAAR